MSTKQIADATLCRNELKKIYEERRLSSEEALYALQKEVRALLEAHGYTPTIKYRVKRFNNYFEKLQKVRKGVKGGEDGLITDLLGLRIICPFLEDLETIEGLLSEQFEIVEAQRKGAQNSFREFGYDSVHMLIKLKDWDRSASIPYAGDVCEVQLRTILQDAWAEVEHELVYKSDIDMPNESIKRKLASLNATLTLSDLIFQEIRDYQKEVRSRGRKRRRSLEERFLDQDLISISHQAEWHVAEAQPLGPLPNPLASDVEKTMLAALNAHSHNDLEAAIGLYGKLLGMELEPRLRALVYNHRGMAHFARADYVKANQDFSRSISEDESSCRSWSNRGLVNRVLKNYQHSVADYDQALEIDPSHYEGYFGRAQTYCEMQLPLKALSDCEQALKIQPDFQPALQLYGVLRSVSVSGDRGPVAGDT